MSSGQVWMQVSETKLREKGSSGSHAGRALRPKGIQDSVPIPSLSRASNLLQSPGSATFFCRILAADRCYEFHFSQPGSWKTA